MKFESILFPLLWLTFIQADPVPVSQENDRSKAHGSSDYCFSKGCVKAASDMIGDMDETVNPCDDFYKFACGNFIKKTVIPEHKTKVDRFSVIGDKLNERLRKLFEEKSNGKEPEVFSSVRNLYKSCLNEQQIEESSKDELENLLLILGGWPVVEGDKWTEEGFTWYLMSQNSGNCGFSSNNLINLGIGLDSKDSTKRIIELDEAILLLPREYLLQGSGHKDVKAYYQYMIDTAVWMGAKPEDAANEMKEVLDFELILANLTLPQEKRRNKSDLYNPMTIKEVSQIYPGIPWVSHINQILNNPQVTVDDAEIVNVAVPNFIHQLNKTIPTIPARVQANYIIWRNVASSMKYMNEEANEITLKFLKVLTGKAIKSPRWEKCVSNAVGSSLSNAIGSSLSNAIGSMFVRKYFKGEAKVIADTMVSNVINEFKVMLDELAWMDPKTKELAREKANLINPHIAYTKELLDDNILNEFYLGLSLREEGYLQNMLKLTLFTSTRTVGQLRIPYDKNSWETHGGAAAVNAFYNSAENSINFPAGILDGAFFAADRPLYMNYGAIGYVIGHEITHGFDDQGSQKDGYGNLVNWWQPKAKENYLRKTRCVIDQYSNYTVEVNGEIIIINGVNTQGENIADLGGAKEAYRAYNKVVEENGPDPLLPGLKYNQRQLFWLSSAQVWCNVVRPRRLKVSVLTGKHSPGVFRVNGPFANMPEFAKDWSCPLHSRMNPPKKCTVW